MVRKLLRNWNAVIALIAIVGVFAAGEAPFQGDRASCVPPVAAVSETC